MINSVIIIQEYRLREFILNFLTKFNIKWYGRDDLSSREINCNRSPMLLVIKDNEMKYGELSYYDGNYTDLLRRFNVERENVYHMNKLDDIHKFLKDNNSLKNYVDFMKKIYGDAYIIEMYKPKVKVV